MNKKGKIYTSLGCLDVTYYQDNKSFKFNDNSKAKKIMQELYDYDDWYIKLSSNKEPFIEIHVFDGKFGNPEYKILFDKI